MWVEIITTLLTSPAYSNVFQDTTLYKPVYNKKKDSIEVRFTNKALNEYKSIIKECFDSGKDNFLKSFYKNEYNFLKYLSEIDNEPKDIININDIKLLKEELDKFKEESIDEHLDNKLIF